MKRHSLSQAQKRIWYTQQKQPISPMFIIGGTVRLRGNADLCALKSAIAHTVEQNAALQLRFTSDGDHILQYLGSIKEIPIDHMDFSDRSNPAGAFEDWCRGEMQTPFTLEDAPLCSFAVFRLGPTDTGYFLKLHHLVADGWSVKLLTDQIAGAYQTLTAGESLDINHQPSYIDCAQSEQRTLSDATTNPHRAYWLAQMEHASVPGRNDTQNFSARRKSFVLGHALYQQLQRFIQQHSLSLHTLFTGLYLLQCYKTTGEMDSLIGIPLLGRSGKKERATFGTFTNTMPFFWHMDPKQPLKQLFEALTAALMECYAHQKYPYNLLYDELQRSRHDTGELFSVCINTYNTSIQDTLCGMAAENTEWFSGAQPYPLQLVIRTWEKGRLQLDFDYQTQLYTDRAIDRMYGQLLRLLLQLLKNPSICPAELCLLSRPESDRRVIQWNQTDGAFPRNETCVGLFEQSCRKNPDQIAVSDDHEDFSYRTLADSVAHLAGNLAAQGIKRGTVVGALLAHNPQSIAAILAIMHCGGVYLPLDPSSPPARMQKILHSANAAFLLTDRQTELAFGEQTLHLSQMLHIAPPVAVRNQAHPDDLAYIIYTSGSCGDPKGVMIRHRNLLNYLWWAKDTYLAEKNEVFALYSSFAFDFTMTALFLPLISGGQIRLFPGQREENIFQKIARDGKTSVLKITPAHIPLLLDANLDGLPVHSIIIGGEDVKSGPCRQLYDHFGGRAVIYNEYGPTEATVGCMTYIYRPEQSDCGSVPIGRPIRNTQIYLLDRDMQPVDDETPGEIYIGGEPVAAGYHAAPEKTKEAFVPSLFLPGSTLYKTGDLAVRSSDGALRFTGRNDALVKLHGHRVELHEIERQILRSGLTKDACVQVKEIGAGDILCAYLLAKDSYDESLLTSFLRQTLPDYMIPAFFICLQNFPLTVNGKIDAKKLPLPERKSSGAVSEPCAESAQLLCAALQKLLPDQAIGLEDNFYALGGDSIKAIQLSSSLAEQGLALSVGDILRNPVIAQMATHAKQAETQTAAALSRDVFDPPPIVSWFLSQHFEEAGCYNQSVLLLLKRQISPETIGNALDALCAHHDALRINLTQDGQSLYENVSHCKQTITVPEMQLPALGGLSALRHNFDLQRDLLIAPRLIHTQEADYLFLCAHHLVIDGVSWQILLHELGSLLNLAAENCPLTLGQKPVSYQRYAQMARDFIHRHASGPLQSTRSNDMVPGKYEDAILLEFSLEAYITRLLLTQTVWENMRIHELLLAMVHLALDQAFSFEVEGHGRDLSDTLHTGRTVGWFTNIYPLTLRKIHESLGTQLCVWSSQMREAEKNKFTRSLTLSDPPIQTYRPHTARFNYLGSFAQCDNDWFTLTPYLHPHDIGKRNTLSNPLGVDALIIGERLHLRLTFDAALFSISYAHQVEEKLRQRIQALAAHLGA